MYSLNDLLTALKHPNMALRECNRIYNHRFGTRTFNTAGDDILKEDWDLLFILDACRYDMFSSTNPISGTLEKRTSKGANTVEFLRGNFAEKELYDTVYVTANPQLHRFRDEIDVRFYDVINVWSESGWNEKHRTVLPETMTEAAIEAARQYKNKRLIFHYIQPHYPFVNSDINIGKDQLTDPSATKENVWVQLMKAKTEIDPSKVIEAYYENLEAVYPHLKKAIDECVGKAVITSDHGNCLGDRARPIPIQEWGHPNGIHVDELLTVPWLITEFEQRREVVSEKSSLTREVGSDTNVVKGRLADLGYV